MSFVSGVILCVYIIILFLLSAFFVKRALNSYEEYILCGRSLTIGFIIFTYLGTWVGGGTIIGLAGMSYEEGARSYWLFAIPTIVCYIFAFLFITRIRKLKLNSIGDMLSLRYPHKMELIRIPVAISLMIRNVTMIGMQFSALSYLLIYSFKIDRNLAILATFVIITGYTFLSGLWGVVITDVFQGFLQTLGLVIILFLCIKLSGGFVGLNQFFSSTEQGNLLSLVGNDVKQWGKDTGVYLFSFGAFFLMGDQCDWERIFSGKTDKAVFWGYLIPLTITLMLLISPTYIGVFQRATNLTHIDSGFIIYRFLLSNLGPVLAGFLIMTLFSAIMSSADSYMFATGVIFSNDIINRFINKEAEDKELIFWTRIAVMLSGAVGFAFAINIGDPIYLWITGLSVPVMVILPAYIYAWFSKRVNTQGAIAGIIFGGIFAFKFLILDEKILLSSIMYVMIGNFAVTYIVSLFYPKSSKAVEETFYKSSKFDNVSNIPK